MVYYDLFYDYFIVETPAWIYNIVNVDILLS